MMMLIAALVGVLAAGASAPDGVTKDDLNRLASAGLSDGVLVAYIQSHGPPPRLSADDLIELKNARVSNFVLERLAGSLPASGSQAPAASVPPTVERRVVMAVAPPVVPAPVIWTYPWGPWRSCAPCLRFAVRW